MDAGLPKGVFSIVHGSQTVAKAGAVAAHFTRNTNPATPCRVRGFGVS